MGISKMLSPVHLADIQHRRYDVSELVVGHAGKEGEGDESFPEWRGGFEVIGLPAESFCIVGVQMERTPMDRAAHAPFFELIDECVSIDRELFEMETNGKEVPGMDAIFGPDGKV